MIETRSLIVTITAKKGDTPDDLWELMHRVCPGCAIPLSPTSGGKLQCRKCGALVTCCD